MFFLVLIILVLKPTSQATADITYWAADQILSITKHQIFLNCSTNSLKKVHVVVLLCLNVQTMKSQF